MDTAISSFINRIQSESLPTPTPPSTEFNSTLYTTQQPPDIASTSAGDIPPPRLLNSINELRSFSTALSAFLSGYDELQNHLSFIGSSIDSKLSGKLVDAARPNLSVSVDSDGIDTSKMSEVVHALEDPEEIDVCKKVAIVSEQNPNGMATDCEQSRENMRTPECLENDESRKPEVNDTSKKREQIDILKRPEETAILKKSELTVILNKPKEIGILKKAEKADTCKNPKDIDASMSTVGIYTWKNPGEAEAVKKHEETGISKDAEETDVSRKPKVPEYLKKCIVPVLQFACQNMDSKLVRKHVSAHLSEMKKLHKEIANALKLAGDPAKLVLDSVGRFFVQGRISFWKDLRPTLSRLLILECFVMINSYGIEISKTEKEYAAEVAADWRNRMIREGGLRLTNETDARGLLLFISGFGIQDDVFKIQDILDLIRASNVKGISTALRSSVFLIPKIPEVIELMVKNNLEIEAADIAYTFGLEDVCHPQNILRTYLHNLVKDIQSGSFQTLEAMEQHLCDLKSVRQCLESHNVDPSILLPDFKINETIQNLEKETTEGRLIQTTKFLENPIHPEANHESTQKKPAGHAETDVSKKPEETFAETSCAQPIIVVPEAIVSEQNTSRMDTNCKQTPEMVEVIGILKKPEEANPCKNPEETETENSKKSIISVLELLCQKKYFRKVKRHITTHYSEMKNIQKEITKVLKLSKDPAKLVLDFIGRFFIQRSRTFCKDSPQTSVRLVSVLILECFVMIGSDGIEIAKTDKKYAAEAAADWRDRMIKEGGLGHTDGVDARGLLLFISGFGIQDDVFKIQDIVDLVRASNVKGISIALCHSVFLIPKIPEVVDLMVKNNLEIEAVDIAYTFGLEDMCHTQNILRKYLHSLVQDIQNGSSFQTLEEMKQQLCDLKSVKECLESHNVDPSVLLPDFKIDEMIEYLVKEINVDRVMTHKRKSLENPTPHQEAKRACLIYENTSPQHKPVVDHHVMIRCNRSTQPSTCYSFENIDGSVPNGPANGVPETSDQMVRRVLNGPAYGVSSSYDQMVHRAPNGPAYSAHGSYDQMVRRAPNGPAYGVHGSYDQTVHRADVPPYGWRGASGLTYDSQPHNRPWEWDLPESHTRFQDVPPSVGFLGRRAPPEPFDEFQNVPPYGDFPRSRGASAYLHSFADKVLRESHGFHTR